MIHFSVDDTFGCFRWLTQNQLNVNSIFESTSFDFAKILYEQFGIGTDFYCIYKMADLSLDDMSDSFVGQFQENKNWLKFGFHSYESDSNYNDIEAEVFASGYDRTISALKRIAGDGAISDTTRLHFFSGNPQISSFLRTRGIKKLLCSDDERISYGLRQCEQQMVNEKHRYVCEKSGMVFVKSVKRLEYIKDVGEISFKDEDFYFFTHERYLDKHMYHVLERILRHMNSI